MLGTANDPISERTGLRDANDARAECRVRGGTKIVRQIHRRGRHEADGVVASMTAGRPQAKQRGNAKQ
jgi:hypothetical protein